jgi:hypothetical protein
MLVAWAIFGVLLMFYGTIWLWSSLRGKSSVLDMYRVSHGFQAKVDNPYALNLLTSCLQKALPNRNATVADFSTCLKAMGMKDAPVG